MVFFIIYNTIFIFEKFNPQTMEIKDIQKLIKFIVQSGAAEIYFKDENIEINVKNQADVVQAMVPQLQVTQGAQGAAQPEDVVSGFSDKPKDESLTDESKYVTIKAPMIGTFYRKPSPDKPNFVEVGDTVGADSTVCIIEAMKLFNEIEAEVSGTIVKVLVEDSSPVEYDQPLFLVDPS